MPENTEPIVAEEVEGMVVETVVETVVCEVTGDTISITDAFEIKG